MDWNQIEGNWKQGKAKEKWGKLTDDELDQIHCDPHAVSGTEFRHVAVTGSGGEGGE